MLKRLLLLAVVSAVAAGSADAATSKTGGRSFEECHALAVSRGIHPKKRPERYEMLKAHGQKTKPQGLIARCMAGQQV